MNDTASCRCTVSQVVFSNPHAHRCKMGAGASTGRIDQSGIWRGKRPGGACSLYIPREYYSSLLNHTLMVWFVVDKARGKGAHCGAAS